MTRSLVHPRMTARLTAGQFFPHTVSAEVSTEIQDSTGEVVSTSWGVVPAMRSLPCRISTSTGKQEAHLEFATTTEITHVIVIVGNYTDLLNTKHRLVGSDGFLYDVVGIALDSTGTNTRVLARVVSV